jgi:hypothetical protein
LAVADPFSEVQPSVACLIETRYLRLHIEKEGIMKNLLPAEPWKAFALLIVTYFITIVDFTIVNVALPTIGRDLRFPEPDLLGRRRLLCCRPRCRS